MITILSYVSKDMYQLDEIHVDFAKLMIDLTAGENVLIGRKVFEQDMQEKGIPGTKTHVLSRSHKFTGAKAVKEPTDFHEGYVLGGKSTIASMMPYSGLMILGIEKTNAQAGIKFPALNGWDLTEQIEEDTFIIRMYKHVRFTK